jgi:hypothetical protein
MMSSVSSQSVASTTKSTGRAQATWEEAGSPKPSWSVSAYQVWPGIASGSASSQSVESSVESAGIVQATVVDPGSPKPS